MSLSEAISLFVGVIGTAIAIYQAAQINASRERLREVQFLLAGFNSLAIMKQVAWRNQMNFFANPTDDKGKELYRIHVRASDDFAEMASVMSALEGTITTGESAIFAVMEKALKQAELNSKLQVEAQKTLTLHATEPKA
ncbi:hypothetical protein [Undibacterium sp.]|jgi:hypothetical protein|uniref:hypothetical protein n=1 Tax=Undibacterium sp. TaxID=1914977 RepID=UPI002C779A58|nr:hypothetical protein [Undibacterium sp.]HTD05663.1 hypothetical protein [Undibacterium sp.]